MKIYRGVQDRLFKDIDHLFKNEDLTFLDYGQGTSYAYEKTLAEDYCNTSKNYAWLIVAEFTPKNPLHIYPKTLVEEDNIDEGFFFEGNIIQRNDIADYANTKGHDCIIFEYDDSDPHILLLESATLDSIEELYLYTEKQCLVTPIKKLKFPFDGTIFTIPLNKTDKVDEIIKSVLE